MLRAEEWFVRKLYTGITKPISSLALNVKANQFEGHLMVLSRAVDSKVLRMAIISLSIFTDKKAK